MKSLMIQLFNISEFPGVIQMNIKKRNYFILILIIVSFFIFNNLVITSAAEIKASTYEINLEIDGPTRGVSERIILERVLKEEAGNSIYLEPSRLSNSQGERIPENFIEIKTPKGNYNLSSNNFLLMTENQDSSWIEVEVNPAVANLRPGTYRGTLTITGLYWHQIDINIIVKPFLRLEIDSKEIEIDVDRPRNNGIYIAKDNIEFVILSNHNNWEITAQLRDNKLMIDNEKTAYILQENILFRIDNNSFSRNEIEKEFISLSEENVIIKNSDLRGNNINIQFAFKLPSNWSKQIAGNYYGDLIFTIKDL